MGTHIGWRTPDGVDHRLGARDIRAIVAQVAASKALTDETVATVVERTGGVPLFVEELTRAVLENGDAKLSGREIPATLHDSLMARLDRLGPAKEVIQIAAVIGSEFSAYELLKRDPSNRCRGKSTTSTPAVWPMRNWCTYVASPLRRAISSSTH